MDLFFIVFCIILKILIEKKERQTMMSWHQRNSLFLRSQLCTCVQNKMSWDSIITIYVSYVHFGKFSDPNQNTIEGAVK